MTAGPSVMMFARPLGLMLFRGSTWRRTRSSVLGVNGGDQGKESQKGSTEEGCKFHRLSDVLLTYCFGYGFTPFIGALWGLDTDQPGEVTHFPHFIDQMSHFMSEMTYILTEISHFMTEMSHSISGSLADGSNSFC